MKIKKNFTSTLGVFFHYGRNISMPAAIKHYSVGVGIIDTNNSLKSGDNAPFAGIGMSYMLLRKFRLHYPCLRFFQQKTLLLCRSF